MEFCNLILHEILYYVEFYAVSEFQNLKSKRNFDRNFTARNFKVKFYLHALELMRYLNLHSAQNSSPS